MKLRLLSTIGIMLVFAIFLSSSAYAQTMSRKLSNPAPSKEAVALYKYIQDMYGKKILSGQMWASWGIDELAYTQTYTGKQPALRGMDYMSTSENNAETQRAIDWWKKGGIPTIMWHWGAPGIGEGYENSKKPININNCFVAGTKEYTAFWSELTKKGDQLQKLKDANVPVLWRPFHELNGGWFWWGMGNGATNETAANKAALFKKLWTTMYNYYVNDRKLNNLIWVLCYTGEPNGAWFPGNQYVDVSGADTYGAGSGPQKTMFDRVKNNIAGNVMPIAYHECGIPPDPDQCLSQGAMWSWWMEWHTTHLEAVDKAYLKKVYNHNLVITLDEIPNIMATYGTITGLEEDNVSNAMSLFPNPVNESLTITLPDAAVNTNSTIRIYNMEGNLVYQEEINQRSNSLINTSLFRTGMYIAKISSNGTETIHKFSKAE